METKVCTKCKKELTVDNFSKNGRNGLRTDCKECIKQYYQNNKESIAVHDKQYYKDNKVTIAKRKKQYIQDNKEAIAEYRKQYQQNNKEILTKKAKQYRQDNKENVTKHEKQYRQDNRVAIAKNKKQYIQEHLEGFCVRNQTRRARKRLLPSTLTTQQWENIKERFNNSCAYCGKELPLTQEHVIPVTKGGEYGHNNIICACQSCNCSKGNKLLNNWYPQHEYYSKKRENKILKYLNYTGKGIQQLSIL